ncbi:hypothetical protein L9F63_007796, partial [Diploptera punctata]
MKTLALIFFVVLLSSAMYMVKAQISNLFQAMSSNEYFEYADKTLKEVIGEIRENSLRPLETSVEELKKVKAGITDGLFSSIDSIVDGVNKVKAEIAENVLSSIDSIVDDVGKVKTEITDDLLPPIDSRLTINRSRK